ncbi:thioredoxin family protein [Flammeovirga sp. SubArs3]|uniref:thioredoxin family protein n=1 Tax=Flammeovirga sp. SubArs3 TaxID=2995316 RepID=UPI00248C27BD|nr:thioredoxin family protein [Flammeovirga sp. SubArs3]
MKDKLSMMRTLIQVILLLFSFNLSAQSVRTIHGNVIDNKNRQPVANVQVSSNHAFQSVQSNEKGEFTLEINKSDGRDTLKLVHANYQIAYHPLKKSRDYCIVYMEPGMPTLEFDDDVKELSTVTVKDKKIKLEKPFLSISLDSALQLANQENKQVLLYVSTSWCGQCKLLDKKLYQQDTVIYRLKNDVIAVEIDADTFEGEKVKKEFTIAGYPTFLMLNPKREVTNRNVGIIFKKHNYDNPNGLFEFIDQGYLNNGNNTVAISNEELKRIQQRKKDHEKMRVGLRFAMHFNSAETTTEENNNHTGYEIGAFVHFNKKRFMLRPGLSYLKINDVSSLLVFSDLGYAFYKKSTLGLPSEIKLLVTPFYQYNYSLSDKLINANNFGMRYGFDFQIGGESTLGFTLCYQHSFDEYYTASNVGFSGIYFGTNLTLFLH